MDATARLPSGCRDSARREASFLHCVFGVRQGTEHTVTVDQQLAAMTLDLES